MKILLKVYTEFNLGDDLFIKMICEKYPDHDFYLISSDEYTTFAETWNNLHIVNIDLYNTSNSFLDRVKNKIFRKIFPKNFNKIITNKFQKEFNKIGIDFDAFLTIGGSIFIQKTQEVQIDYDIIFYNFIIKQFEKKPKIIIGANFGPYFTSTYKESYEYIFHNFSDVCFRDLDSYTIFKNSEKVRLSTDIVFGFETESSEKINNTIGFTITSPKGLLNEDEYILKYTEIIEYYQRNNLTVYLISFCESEGDEQIIEKILSKISNKENVNKLFYDGEINSFLDKYSKIEYMYCGRFHSLILSLLYGQFFIPVAYSKKMINILDDMKYKGEIINLEDLKDHSPEMAKQDKFSSIENLQEESLKQFQKLDQILKINS